MRPNQSTMTLLLVVLTLLTTLNIITIYAANHSSQSEADKINSRSPFDFYTNLEGDDHWFDTTTDDELVSFWANDNHIDIQRRLENMKTFSYTTDIHISLLGFNLQDQTKSRIQLQDEDVDSIIRHTGTTQSHTPLSWMKQLQQQIRFNLIPTTAKTHALTASITELLSKQAQEQFDNTLKWVKDTKLPTQITQQHINNYIFRLSPAGIDHLIITHIQQNQQSLSEKYHIFFLAHLTPSIKFNGQEIKIKYVYTHLVRPNLTPEALSLKPNPRFDFNQHSIPASYSTGQSNSRNTPNTSTIFDPERSIPVVWVDLTAESLTYHALPLQDIPTLELSLPSYLLSSHLPIKMTPKETMESKLHMNKIKKQLAMRIMSLTSHITKNVFLSEFISKAPLLTLSTKITIYHIADHYNDKNMNIINPKFSPNQWKTLIHQIQGIAPKGYLIDIVLQPISLSQCILCLNSINNSIRSDPSHVMGGMDGRYLDSSTMFDLFEAFNLNQWAGEGSNSQQNAAFYQHLNDGTLNGQFFKTNSNNIRNTQTTYQREIILWALEPNNEIQTKYGATFLFDKTYQTVANTDKTRILSIMNALPPVSQSLTSLMPLPLTHIGEKGINNIITSAGQSNNVDNLLTTPQLSLYTTLVSVVYGYGSSKSIVFPGGAPVVDSMYVLEGTHPPYSNKVAPTLYSLNNNNNIYTTNSPLVTITSSTTIMNIRHMNLQQLLSDLINTVEATLTTLHDYKLDMSLLPQEGINNIIFRINMLEYKLKLIKIIMSSHFVTTQTSLTGKNNKAARSITDNTIKTPTNHPYTSFSSLELAYGYIFSARHDIGWLLLYFHNIVQKQEPTTICTKDVEEHINTVNGITDLIQHYWSSTLSPLVNDYIATDEDQRLERAKIVNQQHLSGGHLGIDNDINNYLEQQRYQQNSSTPYWLIALDIFFIVLLLSFCCLCCVLGRKRRDVAISMVTDAFSSNNDDGNNNNNNSKNNNNNNKNNTGCCGCRKKNNSGNHRYESLPQYDTNSYSNNNNSIQSSYGF